LKFAWTKLSLKKLSGVLNVCRRRGKGYTESMSDVSQEARSK